MSTKLELLISDIIVRSYSKCSNCYPFTRTHARRRFLVALFSPLSPFSWLQNTWPWMTLNGLKSHFKSYIYYYELPWTNYLLLIYCSLFITRVTMTCNQRRSAGSGVAKSDSQNIGIHEKSADLPWMLYQSINQSINLYLNQARAHKKTEKNNKTHTIVGTLTNNANIITRYI